MAKNNKVKGRFSKLSEVEKALRAREEISHEFVPDPDRCELKDE